MFRNYFCVFSHRTDPTSCTPKRMSKSQGVSGRRRVPIKGNEIDEESLAAYPPFLRFLWPRPFAIDKKPYTYTHRDIIKGEIYIFDPSTKDFHDGGEGRDRRRSKGKRRQDVNPSVRQILGEESVRVTECGH